MIDDDDNIGGCSIDEFACALSERELSQILTDQNIRSKTKVCPICSNDFVDNSYFGETTCGLRSCEEEHERIFGRKTRQKKKSYFKPYKQKIKRSPKTPT